MAMRKEYKPGDVAFVSLHNDMLDFTAGDRYEAERVEGGWAVVPPHSGPAIALPDHLISGTYSSSSSAFEPAVEKRKVGKALSKQEAEALETFKNDAQQGTGQKSAQPKHAKKSIVDEILAGDAAVEEQEKEVESTDPDEERIKEARAKLVPPPVIVLREGQCWLTDLTDGVLPKSGIDHKITAYRWDYFPEPLRQDIPDFSPYHSWDPNVLEAIHLAHTLNIKNLLVGNPGSGKSTSIEQYAALIRQPFMKINGKSGIDGSAFIGFLWANSNGTQFAEGLLPVAMRNGYLMAIDEVFKIPAEVQMNFQTVYEENGFLLMDEKPGILADKLVKPHHDFRLMATDNARGTGDNFEKFGATQVQDSSTLDRFGLTAFVPYLGLEQEVAVLQRMYPQIRESALTRLVRAAGMVREAYGKSNVSLTLSLRGLKVMARLLLMGVSEKAAFSMVYESKLADDDEINTIESCVNAVGLSTVPGDALLSQANPQIIGADVSNGESEHVATVAWGDVIA